MGIRGGMHIGGVRASIRPVVARGRPIPGRNTGMPDTGPKPSQPNSTQSFGDLFSQLDKASSVYGGTPLWSYRTGEPGVNAVG